MKKYALLLSIGLLGIFAFQYEKSPEPVNIVINGKMFTSLYQQKAAEYKALCYQAYAVAHFQLDNALLKKSIKPLAVISDIDETILDNSPFAVHQALLGKGYEPGAWHEWTDRAEADTLAGALTFFKYAASKKVEVFYVTNRDDKEKASTLRNLQKFSFPNADEAHLIVKGAVSSKEERRKAIMSGHNVVLLIGDNLADFSDLFDNKKTTAERTEAVSKAAAEFGKKFIVLPNPNYGDWENVVYGKLTDGQKDSVIKATVKGF